MKQNINDLIEKGNKLLKDKQILSYQLDTELLLCEVLNKNRDYLFLNNNEILNENSIKKFNELIKRRSKKEPLAYITNKKEFWKTSFYVNKSVLIPRPDTEILIEEMLKYYNKKDNISVLDIGTGSGCIIISLLKERKNFTGTAIDISKKALNIAKYNAKIHHLDNRIKFFKSSVDNFFKGKYDLIISNPPYISSLKLKYLETDILRYEPIQAIEGGLDGLKIYKKIVKKSSGMLKRGGKLILEIGFDQKLKMLKLLSKENFFVNKIVKDYGKRDRCLICTKL